LELIKVEEGEEKVIEIDLIEVEVEVKEDLIKVVLDKEDPVDLVDRVVEDLVDLVVLEIKEGQVDLVDQEVEDLVDLEVLMDKEIGEVKIILEEINLEVTPQINMEEDMDLDGDKT
jgi:hypothetical protein